MRKALRHASCTIVMFFSGKAWFAYGFAYGLLMVCLWFAYGNLQHFLPIAVSLSACYALAHSGGFAYGNPREIFPSHIAPPPLPSSLGVLGPCLAFPVRSGLALVVAVVAALVGRVSPCAP